MIHKVDGTGMCGACRLQVGDEIILTIQNSEIENLRREDTKEAKITIEQLQLSTQRIKS